MSGQCVRCAHSRACVCYSGGYHHRASAVQGTCDARSRGRVASHNLQSPLTLRRDVAVLLYDRFDGWATHLRLTREFCARRGGFCGDPGAYEFFALRFFMSSWEVEEHIRGTEAFARYMSAKKSASKQKEAPPGESDSEDDPYEAGEEDEASGSDAAEEQKKKSSELESEDEEELDVLAAALSTSAKKRKRSPAVQIGVLPEVTLTNVIEGKRARPEPGKFAKIARELAEHR